MNRLNLVPPSAAPVVAFEGLDGSGKSTQVKLLSAWLEEHKIKHHVFALFHNSILTVQFQTLNASGLIGAREATLMHAAELAGRVEYLAKPLRAKGEVIIWDKYVVGARMRDRARGHPEDLLDALYSSFPEPDLTIYLRIEPELATLRKRVLGGPNMWESGLDALVAAPISEIQARLSAGAISATEVDHHFATFQGRIHAGYDEYFRTQPCLSLDGRQSPHYLRRQITSAVTPYLAALHR
jgi:dTMP kinase